MENLPEDGKLAYTSVSTILHILQKKQLVHYQKSGRQHVYVPKISKFGFIRYGFRSVSELFDTNPAELAVFLWNDHNLTKEELMSLKTLIQKKPKAVG